MTKTIKVLGWVPLTVLALGLSLAALGCDDDPGFGTGLDNGKLPDGVCAEYPGENQAWALDTVVPPSVFEGDPKDLDLDAAWCNKGSVKSLFFVLGYPT
jgi:hypothetical protein